MDVSVNTSLDGDFDYRGSDVRKFLQRVVYIRFKDLRNRTKDSKQVIHKRVQPPELK